MFTFYETPDGFVIPKSMVLDMPIGIEFMDEEESKAFEAQWKEKERERKKEAEQRRQKIKLKKQEDLRKKMGHAGHAYVLEAYAWEAVEKRMMEALS